jgi:Tfp pilus assembly protein FimT
MIEVLLTLAILVMIAAFAWPGMRNAFASRRLRAAADQIRAQWTSMRIDAMRSDSTRIFRYCPGGRDFRIDCNSTTEAVVDPSTGLMTGSVVLGTENLNISHEGDLLPEGIFFVDAQIENDPRAVNVVLPQDTIAPTTGSEWSFPIFFYPDGTTSSVTLLTLRSDRGQAIDVAIRGLTGVVKVSQVYTLQSTFP